MHELLIDLADEKELLKRARSWKYEQTQKERRAAMGKTLYRQRPKIMCDLCNKMYKNIVEHRRTLGHINKTANPLIEASKSNKILLSVLSSREDERGIIERLRDQKKKDYETIESLKSKLDVLHHEKARLEEQIDSFLQ